MSAYTLAMLGLALLLVGVLVANRRRGSAPTGHAGAEVARALAETASTATAAPAGPMPLSPPSADADVPAGWTTMPAPVPAADTDPDRPFPSPFESPTPLAWADEELVTAPGWPMPGELDLSWSGPAPVGPADPDTTHPAPDRVETEVVAADADDAAMPRWEPLEAIDLGGLPEPPAVTETPEGVAGGEGAVHPAAEEAEPASVWAEAPAGEDTGGFAMPSWDGAGLAVAAPEAPEADGVPASGEGDVEIAWLETAASAVPEVAAAPEAAAAAEGGGAGIAWLSPAPPAPTAALAPEPIAWLDTVPAAPPAPPGPRGRFAVGGTAQAAGDQAVAAVAFGRPLDAAPGDWRVGPAPDAAPGTLVIEVEGTVNGAGDTLAVMDAPGFAPTCEGFTVRAAALAPGHFAVAGTYRIL